MGFNTSSRAFKFIIRLTSTGFQARSFSTSVVLLRGVGLWRIKNNIPAKGREYGPLTDLPDWSYSDGRPAPLLENQKKKIMLHANYCKQIIKLSKEVDECFELNEQKEEMEKQIQQNVIRNRLKSKGKPVI